MRSVHLVCHVIYVEEYLTNNPCVRQHMRSGQKRLETEYASLTNASAAAVLQNLNYRLLVSAIIFFISFLTSCHAFIFNVVPFHFQDEYSFEG